MSRDREGNKAAKFRIGGPEEALFILYQRGDTPKEISDRFGLAKEEVEAIIQRCRSGKQ